jgi:hypothetical protein
MHIFNRIHPAPNIYNILEVFMTVQVRIRKLEKDVLRFYKYVLEHARYCQVLGVYFLF